MVNPYVMILALWVFTGVATFVIGTQAGGRALVWGLTGILGPVGMLIAIIVPGFSGKYGDSSKIRWLAFGFSFGLFVIVELMLRSVGARSAFGNLVLK